MSIRRAPRPESNFYLLDKTISEDRRLSWGARGMLIFLLGKPDHWVVSVKNLIKQTAQAGKRSGRDAVYGFLKELETAGYLKRERSRADGGAFESVDYIVCEDPEAPLAETPLTENPDVVDPPHPGLPDTVQPDTANPTQVSIEESVSIESAASTERETPALPSEPRTQLDDFGRPMQPPIDPPEKFSMHRDWKPDAEQLKTEFYRRGMGMNVEYQSGDLIDFTAYFADLPGMQRSHSWWTARFAGWVQENNERKQQRQQTTGDNDNANGTGADQNDQRRARDGVRDLLANPRDTSWADGLWTDSDSRHRYTQHKNH